MARELDPRRDGRSGLRLLLSGALLCAQLASGSLAARAAAGEIRVTEAADTNGACADTGRAPCSLRDAIRFANRAGGGEAARIVLPAGVYALAQGGSGEDEALGGDLDIRADLAIVGAGPGITIVDGGGIDRVFDVLGGATASMVGLTIRNGHPQDSYGNGGGAIKNLGTLTLFEVAIADNRSTSAGGIFNGGAMAIVATSVVGNRGDYDSGGINNSGTMTVDTSVIAENRSPSSGGGGIGNWFNARLTIRSTLIRDNEAQGDGGGLVNLSGGEVTALNVYIAGNRANNGGGIDNTGARLSLRSSVVAGNAARSRGGGIRSGFQAVDKPVGLELSGVAIDRNSANWGGGLFSEGRGQTTIEASAITGNVAEGYVGAGGIYNGGLATLDLRNSTIAGNGAPYRANGDNAPRTGGLLNEYRARTTLTHVTVAGHAFGITSVGGEGEVRLRGTIVSGPTDARNCVGKVGDDGYNLDSGTACGFDPALGSASGTDPLLDEPRAYAINGPAIYPLGAGSPAIDRIPTTDTNCPAADGRGVARPQGRGCDSGAFERASGDRSATDVPEATASGQLLPAAPLSASDRCSTLEAYIWRVDAPISPAAHEAGPPVPGRGRPFTGEADPCVNSSPSSSGTAPTAH